MMFSLKGKKLVLGGGKSDWATLFRENENRNMTLKRQCGLFTNFMSMKAIMERYTLIIASMSGYLNRFFN